MSTERTTEPTTAEERKVWQWRDQNGLPLSNQHIIDRLIVDYNTLAVRNRALEAARDDYRQEAEIIFARARRAENKNRVLEDRCKARLVLAEEYISAERMEAYIADRRRLCALLAEE